MCIRDRHNKVVLVVEDYISSQMLLKTILARTGVKVLVAEDGETAISLVESNDDIDMVLMDIRLKGLDGLQATQQIKQLKPNTPVIAQTACAIMGDMEKCLNAGCNAYITKPIETTLLLETMDYYFRRAIDQEKIDNVMYSN